MYNPICIIKDVKPLLLSVVVVCLGLGACHRDIQNEDAVRRGIMNYLSKRSDLTAMDVTITNVAFRQNEADATVHFQAKNSTAPGSGLDLKYVLERKDNEWVVKGRAAGSEHGMGMPGGAMPGGAMPGGAMPGGLPPGHPGIPPSHPAMPPGHPAIPPQSSGPPK